MDNDHDAPPRNSTLSAAAPVAAAAEFNTDAVPVDESVPQILMSSPPPPLQNPPARSTVPTSIAPQPLPPLGNSNGVARTKLRKKRGDASRRHFTDGGGGSQAGGGAHHHLPAEQEQQQQQQQSLRRRIARARWSVLMLLPALMVFLFRAERVEVESHHLLTVGVTCSIFSFFALTTSLNEIFGRSHFATYAVVLLFSVMWGSVILAIRDLTAARLGCMVWFGFCSGNMRYHWDDDASSSAATRGARSPAAAAYTVVSRGPATSSGRGTTRVTKQQLLPSPGYAGVSASMLEAVAESTANQLSFGGYSSGSTNVPHSDASTAAAHGAGGRAASRAGGTGPLTRFPSPGSGASTTEGTGEGHTRGALHATADDVDDGGASIAALHESDANIDELMMSPQLRWSELWNRTWRFCTASVWRKVGLGLCATLGEVIGCAANVPNSWSEVIAVSWLGYAALILAPIVVYKCASWVSHVLVLLCGSRVNTADASRMLFLYWVVTTVLSLGTLIVTVVWLLTSIVPYIWALQVLVTPYSILFELIAFESKEYRASNPYKDVAEVYREHIHDTMEKSREYFVH